MTRFQVGDRVTTPGFPERRPATVIEVGFWNPKLKRPKVKVIVQLDDTTGWGGQRQYSPRELQRVKGDS